MKNYQVISSFGCGRLLALEVQALTLCCNNVYTSIQPYDYWLGSRVLFSFNKVIKQSSLILVFHGNVTRILLKFDMWLPRQIAYCISLRN